MHTFDISAQIQGVDDLCDGVVMAQVLNQMYDVRYYINDCVIMLNAHGWTFKKIICKQCDCMAQLKSRIQFLVEMYVGNNWLIIVL